MTQERAKALLKEWERVIQSNGHLYDTSITQSEEDEIWAHWNSMPISASLFVALEEIANGVTK